VTDKILIAEDEHPLRHVMLTALRKGDPSYEADEAEDGAVALQKLRDAHYDLLVTDLVMPNMDGVELLHTLHDEMPGLPVIVLTAMTDAEYILNCFKEGAWDYCLKPFDVHVLRAAVRRALMIGDRFEQRTDDFKLLAEGARHIELYAASDVEYVLRFRIFTEILLRAQIPASLREDIRLAIEEIGKNAVEWGNKNDRGKRIRMAYTCDGETLTFEVEDEGEGFKPEDVPDPTADPLAHIQRRIEEGKRAGGYGLHIIKQVMDEVVFNERGNKVTMTKRL